MKKIAIITLNYNGKQDTLELLESINKSLVTSDKLLVIVVDNASSDGSVSAIKQQFPAVDIVQSGANLGFAGGFNKGIEYAKAWGADYFLLINNDCLIKDNNLIENLVKTADSDPEIGLISPKIYFAPGFEFHKDRYKTEDQGKVIWFAGGKFDWNNIGSVHRGLDDVDNGKYDQIEESEIFSGACVLIKKEVFETLRLRSGQAFDDKYFLYFEDSDFSIRAKEVGFKIYYNGETSICHKVSQSTGTGSDITDYFHTRNRLLFGFKYASIRTKFALLREAVKLFLFGRKAQKLGVWNFITGSTGDLPVNPISPPEYPFKLSIVTVNYNTPDLVLNLLKSIFSSKGRPASGWDPETMEVIVLDNGNVDPCKEKIKDYLSRIKYLKNEENKGFPKGYNRAINFSTGEYVLMLNSDIEITEKSLSGILEKAEEYHGNAVISGKLIFPDGIIQDSVFHLPTIGGALKEYFLKIKGAYFMYVPKTEKTIEIDGAVMAVYLIPRKILNKVGLLDENIFIFFEDVEYARRLKQNNIPIYFDPTLQFLHYHGASTKKQGVAKSYEQLIKSSMYYHGKFYYWLLYYTLLFCQKFSGTRTPGEIR